MSFKYIDGKKLVFVMFLIIYLLFFTSAVNAESSKVIFNHLDGIGDDYGPGGYSYPQNKIFQDKGHLFDIKSLTIFENKSEFIFRFSFSHLTDPWGAEFSFSLPLIELYIDNDLGGSNQLFQKGANVRFQSDFYWNKFLKISGWWVRVFNPDSQKENLLNINELTLAEPYSVENLNLSKENNTLYLRVPKTEIVSLENSKILLMIGSFDPFGYDYFRSLSKDKASWQILSTNEVEIKKAPRVLDILVPGGESQKEILSGAIPEVPYLRVQTPAVEREKNLVDHLMTVNKRSISISIVYILLIIFIIYKFNYKRKKQ